MSINSTIIIESIPQRCKWIGSTATSISSMQRRRIVLPTVVKIRPTRLVLYMLNGLLYEHNKLYRSRPPMELSVAGQWERRCYVHFCFKKNDWSRRRQVVHSFAVACWGHRYAFVLLRTFLITRRVRVIGKILNVFIFCVVIVDEFDRPL